MSPEGDQEYFADGIAEEIINALTRIEHLRVASRTSSFQFKETSLDSREIGDRLGVDTLLEGSVRMAGNQLRIMAQLIDVADGCHIWSQRFDRELRDIFEVQDEIAQSVVKALRLTLDPDRARQVGGKGHRSRGRSRRLPGQTLPPGRDDGADPADATGGSGVQ